MAEVRLKMQTIFTLTSGSFRINTAYAASASVLKVAQTYELPEDVQELRSKHVEAIVRITLCNELVLNIMHSLRRDLFRTTEARARNK